MERGNGRQGSGEETRQHGEAAWRWQRGAVAAAVLSLAAGAGVLAGGAHCRGLPGEDAPSSIVLASPDEPGEPLLVRGRVFAPDGETPVPGVVLYVYQTDAEGHYSRATRRAPPRLRGWVRTDEAGRYEVRTIRPGSYPSRRAAAHVHVQLWGAGYEPQYSTDLLFADDPLLPDRDRQRSRAAGAFAHVCEPGRAAGGELVCTHNHRLKPQGDDLDQNVRHGLDVPMGEG
jgi:protocatechuate 3,4-dioxygenase, beta subunit